MVRKVFDKIRWLYWYVYKRDAVRTKVDRHEAMAKNWSTIRSIMSEVSKKRS